jgi:Co/Zn/Cd efflux system component
MGKNKTQPDEGRKASQRRLLWTVLIINFAFFIIEMTTGLISKSIGLVADSLDMLADAFVYGISLLAVGGTILMKKNTAKLAGILQFILAIAGLTEVIRRFTGVEIIPDFRLMIIVSFFSVIANGICLYLLSKSGSSEAHMKASIIFTSNDVLINLGVIAAGILVHVFHSNIPDLVIGAIVFLIVTKAAVKIYRLGK